MRKYWQAKVKYYEDMMEGMHAAFEGLIKVTQPSNGDFAEQQELIGNMIMARDWAKSMVARHEER